MPQVFKLQGYSVYFWSLEGHPLEPVHVHISKGIPSKTGTKVWITENGKCLLANNKSHIPAKALRNIMDIIEARSFEIIKQWHDYHGEISYYC